MTAVGLSWPASPGWAQRREAFDACHTARLTLEKAQAFHDALSEERADAREKAEAARRLTAAHETVSSLLADLEQALSERDGAIGRIADLREKLETATKRLKLVVASGGAAKSTATAKQGKPNAGPGERLTEHGDGKPVPTFDARAHQQRVEQAVNRYYDTHPPAPAKRPLVPRQNEARAAMVLNRNK